MKARVKLQYGVLLIIAFAVGKNLSAQDPYFTQFYTSPIFLNPAFTGNTTQGRLASNYRKQWPNVPRAFTFYSFSFDYNFDEVKSGFGLLAFRDEAGSSGYALNSLSLSYSYKLQINRKVAVRTGIRLGYNQNYLDFSKLVFSDQIQNGGASSVIAEPQIPPYIDISFGGLVYTKGFWGGISLDHVNTPNVSLVGEEDLLPMKFSLHGGYKYVMEEGRSEHQEKSFLFAANYRQQKEFKQLQLGGYYSPYNVVIGLWYSGIPGDRTYGNNPNTDAFSFLLGYLFEDAKIGYSYDLTLSQLTARSGGAHEISLSYEFASRRKKMKKRRFIVPCPKF